jgi:putative Mn2+ efflux pump MntP
MAELLGLVLVALSVGLGNFAGAIAIGLSGVDARMRLRVGLAFGFFESIMPVIGLVIGQQLAAAAGHAGRYFGGGLLVLTGAYAILSSRRSSSGPNAAALRSRARLVVTALALSLDNLVVGFALGVYPVPLAEAAIVIGVVSVALSLVGLELGSRLGARVEAWSEEIGGAVLILVGLALALGFLK